MSFVQRFDKNSNRYLKIDGTGHVIAESPHPFTIPGGELLEEIEPVEPERPARAKMSDPLGDMR
ncbi:hypothetical protein [Mesorhizobium sp. B2-1-3A]|uniref:hypothetical protein n=1 Tax=Mesorhizobium sp. B2-1-3A TaxID=2589971 RepID=UPI00112A91FA|nr:hypothetical protein [Mesorhizobium sp. B2-1-3A]TPM89853.1 hypothetical protein FJ977_35330 [Mesorhizobium sp. B2-1-3A]